LKKFIILKNTKYYFKTQNQLRNKNLLEFRFIILDTLKKKINLNASHHMKLFNIKFIILVAEIIVNNNFLSMLESSKA
jgi:hypothetical protein